MGPSAAVSARAFTRSGWETLRLSNPDRIPSAAVCRTPIPWFGDSANNNLHANHLQYEIAGAGIDLGANDPAIADLSCDQLSGIVQHAYSAHILPKIGALEGCHDCQTT